MEKKNDVVIIGGGKSIRKGIELDLWNKIKDRVDIWSINYAYRTLPYLPQCQLWCDLAFFKNNIEDIQKLYQQGVQCHAKIHTIYRQFPEITTYICTRELKEADTKLYIGSMGLSGYFALQLAVKKQYANIWLLGFDFGSDNKITHYYQDQIQVASTGIGDTIVYRSQEGILNSGVKDWELFCRSDVKSLIWNVSLESAIPYFPRVPYEKMFELLNTR